MNKIGAFVSLKAETDIFVEMKKIRDFGGDVCQILVWNMALYTDDNAEKIRRASEEYGIEVSTLWAGWTGPAEWNFTAGPDTLGLVPESYRMKRMEELLCGVDFAVKLGVSRVATHVGFLPENPGDPRYPGVLAVLRYIVDYCKARGISFLFETGQETPTTLLRVIEDLGGENVGINLDTANLILYGKANTADAVAVFGKYVMDTHIKDGFYPTNGRFLGRQVKVGEGMANLPEVVKRLREVGYTGNYIVEREISNEEEQARDIQDTFVFLKEIIGK